MIDVGLSLFRLKGAMSKYVDAATDISPRPICDPALSFSGGQLAHSSLLALDTAVGKEEGGLGI